jgi:hypothetical protein
MTCDMNGSTPQTDTDGKPFYRSKSILGTVIVVAVVIARAAGVDIDEEQIGGLVETGALLLGGILTLWGRITARQKLTL